MRGAAAKKPTLPVCHLCGRQFGSASLAIHLKACAEKYERERGRPPPEAPSASGLLGEERPVGQPMSSEEVEQYNEAAYQAWAGDLEPCPHCARRFLPDRLKVHLRSCGKVSAPGGGGRGDGGDGLTEWERAQGKRAPSGGKKSLPVCYICSREFGTASLAIHIKASPRPRPDRSSCTSPMHACTARAPEPGPKLKRAIPDDALPPPPKACAEKFERENGRPPPPPPEMLEQLTGRAAEVRSTVDEPSMNLP